MAKRFIDTKIWSKAWFRKLKPKAKLIWIYLVTRCDHAGVWDCDWEAAEFFIGDQIAKDDIPEIIWEKMILVEDEQEQTQYFMPSFIEYQYGLLRENSKPHISVLKRLRSKDLDKYIVNSILSVKDKDKEEDGSIEEREEEFKDRVDQIIKEKNYPSDVVSGFASYWTEKNERGRKMKFELQQTFDIARRLVTWMNNHKDWNIKSKEDDHGHTKMRFGDS